MIYIISIFIYRIYYSWKLCQKVKKEVKINIKELNNIYIKYFIIIGIKQ